MKRKLKPTAPDSNPDNSDKAKIKGLLEAVRMDHLDAAEALKRLLSEIDQAAPYLLGKFVLQSDWDLSQDRYQGSNAQQQVYEIRQPDYYDSLDKFLDVEAVSLEEATERSYQEAGYQKAERRR